MLEGLLVGVRAISAAGVIVSLTMALDSIAQRETSSARAPA